jgi:hypothetical protein
MRMLSMFLALSGAVACDGSVVSSGQGDAQRPSVDGGVIRGEDAEVPLPVCPDEPSSALAFDGVDDHVSMGVASSLGLATFTVEAWVRRDGRGTTMGTGVGGLTLVPIAGRGRGENDGSNVDCNYAFGFYGEVLGADFEDMASGANHPVVGRTAIPTGEWHHVAVSYDGTTWRLFVDGALDVEKEAGATPRADSIQHFGIATSFNSMGQSAGHLHGALDEVRVWDRARTAEQIADSMFVPLESGEGLVGRWAIDAVEGEMVLDTTGANDGAATAASYSTGVVLGQGPSPVVTANAPAGDDALGESVSLEIEIDDPDAERFDVTFYARAIDEADDFTMVVLPDTQYYTVQGNDLENYFYDQTQWIVDNAETYDIVGVIHNGDIVDRANQNYQWTIADRAMTTLEGALPAFPDGVPYGVAVGNHDENPNSSPTGTTEFNRWFGVERFAGRAYYGGHYGSNNDENFVTFSAGGLDFVIVNLKFNANPSAAVLSWARQIFESHPESFGILNSHFLLNSSGNFGPQGQRIYDALKDVQNLHLMTCGHVSNERRRTDTFEGHPIHTMLADYQSRANGGGGVMRIWEFSPANDELTVRSYSPTADTWETDGESEFTLSVDLAGAGKEFSEAGTATVVAEDGHALAQITLDGLVPGSRYEWYAVVGDCFNESRTPVQRFTTMP